MFEFISFLSEYLFLFILHICHSETFPKPLTKKQEEEYISLANNGNIKARNKLVEHNLRLVAHIIKKYYHTTSDQDDLVSIGTIGLIKAINTYKPEKNIKLSSYASRCIENEILMHFRNIKKTSKDLSLNDSIDTDNDGNPLTLMDILAVDDNILDDIDKKINLEKLYGFIDEVLNEREKQIIIYRFGLLNCEPMTQQEIADKLSISRSYVSRIEKRTIELLRKRYEQG